MSTTDGPESPDVSVLIGLLIPSLPRLDTKAQTDEDCPVPHWDPGRDPGQKEGYLSQSTPFNENGGGSSFSCLFESRQDHPPTQGRPRLPRTLWADPSVAPTLGSDGEEGSKGRVGKGRRSFPNEDTLPHTQKGTRDQQTLLTLCGPVSTERVSRETGSRDLNPSGRVPSGDVKASTKEGGRREEGR